MQMIDFEYNGEKLSDRNFILCSFDGATEDIEVANQISINQVKAPNSNKSMAVGASYDDNLSRPFSICKNICDDNDDLALSDAELNGIMRWLNRKRFCKFKPIYDDGSFENVYFNATFNIGLVKVGGNIVGLNLTLNTDAPFGFVEPLTYNYTFNTENTSLVINDTSDEVGHVYCTTTIKCLAAGDLTISNSLDTNNTVIIKNCVANETITLYGEQKMIKSDKTHKTLCNDFNYNFLRINNTYDDVKNVFTSNLACEITLSYSPIRKVGLIV